MENVLAGGSEDKLRDSPECSYTNLTAKCHSGVQKLVCESLMRYRRLKIRYKDYIKHILFILAVKFTWATCFDLV